jgi:hypothetical protein
LGLYGINSKPETDNSSLSQSSAVDSSPLNAEDKTTAIFSRRRNHFPHPVNHRQKINLEFSGGDYLANGNKY